MQSSPPVESKNSPLSEAKSGDGGNRTHGRVLPTIQSIDGWVYFITWGCDLKQPIKIGFAENPDKRREQLQVAHPERLHILADFMCDRGMEGRLHKRFAEGHIRGEWFRADTPGLHDFISDALHFDAFPWDTESLAWREVAFA
ncbi:MAG TPA: GIY-YIG nuclease family protein [Vicinamibacterales bacterium]|nr:GIY-YIG nuclease family protein [Vicinamibacterales bacterium]